jgi:thioredoxin
MQVIVCSKCEAKNRVDEARLASSEAKCGRCGAALEVSGEQGSKPLIITDHTFEREVLSARGKPVLVDCWAPWCGPCRIVGPLMDQLAAESHGNYRIAKLNVDDNQLTASRFQVSSIPTMLIFKDGQLIDRLVGAQSKHVIADHLRRAS